MTHVDHLNGSISSPNFQVGIVDDNCFNQTPYQTPWFLVSIGNCENDTNKPILRLLNCFALLPFSKF